MLAYGDGVSDVDARGIDTGIIDVVLVGDIDKIQLDDSEAYIDRKIRALVLSQEEFERLQETKSFKPILKLWESGARLLTKADIDFSAKNKTFRIFHAPSRGAHAFS